MQVLVASLFSPSWAASEFGCFNKGKDLYFEDKSAEALWVN